MLSEIIKKRIEEKAGMKVRYSRDCEILANKIHAECNCRLSGSTIRRLFGFIKGTKEVRLHTLDTISSYLGHPTWDELINTLNKGENTRIKIITEIKSPKLKPGEKYQYSSNPEIEVIIQSLGKSKFKVLSAKNSQLQAEDVFKAEVFSLHHPLFIFELERNGKSLGKIVDAKVSGITALKKI